MSNQPTSPVRTTLVTGGAGFIGSHLSGALLERGNRVICLDNFDDFYNPALKRANVENYLAHPHFLLVEGDVRDRALVLHLCAEHRPQRIAHLAGMANVRYSIERAALYAEVNIQGTINMMDAARQNDVENFVFASTSSIYGTTDQIPFREDQVADKPLAPYPATKKACEVMGAAYHNLFGLNFTALRFFTVYGPRVRPDMMAFMVMDRIIRGQEIELYNGGDMHRDWTFVDDIIAGVIVALDKPLGYEIINLGRGEPVRLSDFIEIIEELVGEGARIKDVPAPVSEPLLTYCNADKARMLLGYEPHTSILEGLKKTWEWYHSLDAIL
jgi:UDP-glucuronate 4-epimerase